MGKYSSLIKICFLTSWWILLPICKLIFGLNVLSLNTLFTNRSKSYYINLLVDSYKQDIDNCSIVGVIKINLQGY